MKVYLLMWLVCGAVCVGAYYVFNWLDRRAIHKLAKDLVDRGDAAHVIEGNFWMFDRRYMFNEKRTRMLKDEVCRIVKERYVES